MGSFLRNVPQTTCSRLPLPLPLWLSPSLLVPPPTVPPLRLSTRKRSFPPSLSPTSMESTTTTARPTSRRQRLKTLTALLPSAMRAPQSSLPSLLRDTAMPPPLLHTPLLPPCTSPLLKPIAQTFKL